MDKNKLIIYCDRGMALCLYCLVFFLPFSIAGVEISAWLGIILWTLKRILGYRTTGLCGIIPETKLNTALMVFFLINALSVVFSMYLQPSFRGLMGKEFKFLLIFFMVVEAISKEKRLKILIYVLMFSAGVVVLDTFVQGYRGVDFIRNSPWMRASASFCTANDFGGWLIVIIPLLCGLLISKSKKGLSWGIKIISAVLIFFLMGCLLFTYSRGAWTGFFIACLIGSFYIVWKMPVKIQIFTLSILLVLFSIFINFFPPIRSGVSSIGAHKFKTGEMLKDRVRVLDTWDMRMQLWKEAVAVVRDHPLLGTGLNTYARIILSYKDKSFDFGFAYPHNSFLQMAAETGIFGLLSFLWVLFEYFKNGFRYLRESRDFLVLGLMSGILAFLLQSFVDTNLYALQLVVLFWFMLGLTVAVMNIEQNDPKNA